MLVVIGAERVGTRVYDSEEECGSTIDVRATDKLYA